MTRRVAQDEVGADSGTPQEGAGHVPIVFGNDLSLRAQERPAAEVEALAAVLLDATYGWPTPNRYTAALDSLLAYIKQLEGELEDEHRAIERAWAERNAETEKAVTAEAQVKQLERERDALEELRRVAKTYYVVSSHVNRQALGDAFAALARTEEPR